MRGCASRLIADRAGAAAPMIALSLFALIAAGGVAFDYSRMAAVDTELQNAADQAALAAASQLDGKAGACLRAASAARAMITNRTLMANEAAGTTPIVIANEPGCDATGNVRFYQNIDKTQAANSDANAKFVEIQVNPRTAFFALTPVVAAVSSGPMIATAFAGLSEAICRVPPLMMCNPNEASDPGFTTANYIGKGVRLIANDGGGNWGPGNFGFLDVNQGNGANALRAALGRQGDPGDCAPGGTVTTEPGNMISLRDALNTRFDMYDNGLNQACNADGSLCPPSANSRKDLLRKGNGNNACGFATGNSNGWHDDTNIYPHEALTTVRDLTDAEIDSLAPMGYPRDKCHSVSVEGVCTPFVNGEPNLIGSGDWDRYAYFRSHSNPARTPQNYAIQSTADMDTFLTNTFATTTPTRYQVYAWEMANAATRLQAYDLGSNQAAHGTPVCIPPGVTPSANAIDRRLLSVAIVNCAAEGVQGRTTGVEVTKWIDIFLVEPSVPRRRTENADVYVEFVRETENSTDGGAIQVVRKSVPYLIE